MCAPIRTSAAGPLHRVSPDEPFALVPWEPKKKKAPPQKREKHMSKRDRQDCGYWAHRAAPSSSEEEWFRHDAWCEKRARVLEALQAAGTGPRQIEAFQFCGAQTVVEWCPEESRYRLRGDYCHNRHCEPCANAKAALIRKNLTAKLGEAKPLQYKFLTLTLKHSDEPLTDQIHRLYASFRELRETPMWRTNVVGGCAMFEVKRSRPFESPPGTPEQWHPHLHCMLEGDYIDQQRIANKWLEITGDSFKVDIRVVKGAKDAAFYVSKYISKGSNAAAFTDPKTAIEFVVSMKGVRTCNTFGSWRGFKLLAKPKDDKVWKPVGLLTNIIQAARAREEWAVGCLKSLLETCQYNPHRKRGPKAPSEDPDDS